MDTLHIILNLFLGMKEVGVYVMSDRSWEKERKSTRLWENKQEYRESDLILTKYI